MRRVTCAYITKNVRHLGVVGAVVQVHQQSGTIGRHRPHVSQSCSGSMFGEVLGTSADSPSYVDSHASPNRLTSTKTAIH